MVKPTDLMDRYAQEIADQLDLVVLSLEGLYEKIVRDNPTMDGIRQFWQLSDQVAANAITMAMFNLRQAFNSLDASLSLPEQVFQQTRLDISEAYYGVAYEAFGAFLAQARVAYTKRLREVVAARAFGLDTFNPEPKFMARNGRNWNFTEAVFLTARQHMVDWYNDAKIAYLTSIGATRFGLLTDDPELMYTSYEITEYPNVAPELFHPRTSKLVAADVST